MKHDIWREPLCCHPLCGPGLAEELPLVVLGPIVDVANAQNEQIHIFCGQCRKLVNCNLLLEHSAGAPVDLYHHDVVHVDIALANTSGDLILITLQVASMLGGKFTARRVRECTQYVPNPSSAPAR